MCRRSTVRLATCAPKRLRIRAGRELTTIPVGIPNRVKELAMECARNDIRIVANNTTSTGMLDILESVHKEISLKGRRWVLGHVRSLSLREIERVAAMGLIVTPHTN